jgi:transposase-like protein
VNVRITHNGQTHTISEWARIYGMNPSTLSNRYRRAGDRPPHLFRPVRRGSSQRLSPP